MAASQGRTAGRRAEEAVRPQPHRFRVNVPEADESVLAWMKLQDNHSLSVRLLIREAIERNGYVDVMNRSVEQLPKRGRPVATDDGAQPSQHRLPPAPEPETPTESEGDVDLDLTPEPDSGPELLGIALPPVASAPVPQPIAAAPAPFPAPSDPEPSGPEPMDVNDVFASLRA